MATHVGTILAIVSVDIHCLGSARCCTQIAIATAIFFAKRTSITFSASATASALSSNPVKNTRLCSRHARRIRKRNSSKIRWTHWQVHRDGFRDVVVVLCEDAIRHRENEKSNPASSHTKSPSRHTRPWAAPSACGSSRSQRRIGYLSDNPTYRSQSLAEARVRLSTISAL